MSRQTAIIAAYFSLFLVVRDAMSAARRSWKAWSSAAARAAAIASYLRSTHRRKKGRSGR